MTVKKLSDHMTGGASIDDAGNVTLHGAMLATAFTQFNVDAAGKLNYLEIGGDAPSIPGPGGLFGFGADDTGTGQPYMILANADNINIVVFGNLSANNRFAFGGTRAWEFELTPYIGTNKVLSEANKIASQADSTAVDVAGLKADFNAFLAKVRAAGLM